MDGQDCVLLAELSWPEVEAFFNEGVDTVILPLGATEQHGPHLPLDTDTRLASTLAERIARRLGDTLVAPPIPVGPSEEHAAFPGTVSITPETLQQLLWDYVESFERQGFERVVVLPGHGGCFPVVSAACPKLAHDSDLDVVAVTDLQRYLELLQEGLREAGIDVDEPVAHAGASETAMLLAIAPEFVDEDRPVGYSESVSQAALFSDGIETYSENGVLGDARPATADAGETILAYVTDAHATYIRNEFEELAA